MFIIFREKQKLCQQYVLSIFQTASWCSNLFRRKHDSLWAVNFNKWILTIFPPFFRVSTEKYNPFRSSIWKLTSKQSCIFFFYDEYELCSLKRNQLHFEIFSDCFLAKRIFGRLLLDGNSSSKIAWWKLWILLVRRVCWNN